MAKSPLTASAMMLRGLKVDVSMLLHVEARA